MKKRDDDTEFSTTREDGGRHGGNRSVPFWLTIEKAARRLSTTPVALRARCRRAQRDQAGNYILAPGMRAFKLGSHWRIEFDWRP
jgi:hypothetical protein